MNSTSEYFREMHNQLADGYRTADGKNSESCIGIAFDIAERMLVEGKHPYISTIKNPGKKLKPLRYEGRMGWEGNHSFCCENGVVYDPVLPGPVSILIYSSHMFGEDFPMTTSFDLDYIRKNSLKDNQS